jgi:hypothetical protein
MHTHSARQPLDVSRLEKRYTLGDKSPVNAGAEQRGEAPHYVLSHKNQVFQKKQDVAEACGSQAHRRAIGRGRKGNCDAGAVHDSDIRDGRKVDLLRCLADHSNTRTQSRLPSWFAPGVEKTCEPLLTNGEPVIAVKVPLLGSYQRAVTGPENLAKFTVRAFPAGP